VPAFSVVFGWRGTLAVALTLQSTLQPAYWSGYALSNLCTESIPRPIGHAQRKPKGDVFVPEDVALAPTRRVYLVRRLKATFPLDALLTNRGYWCRFTTE
jgi:hypothetical protein